MVGRVTLPYNHFANQGIEGLKHNPQILEYLDFFGGDPRDYRDYIDNEIKKEQPVYLGFTLAYDFDECIKLWNAMYINIPGGFYGVDVNNEGTFIVAGYDYY